MSDIVRRGEGFPEPQGPHGQFFIEGEVVGANVSHELARRTELGPHEPGVTSEDLQAMLAQPLYNGFRPYTEDTKIKGMVRLVSRHTARLDTEFPTAVPTEDGTLQPATLLERVIFNSTIAWGFRSDGHSKFSGIPNRGHWAINPRGIGSLTAEPAVVMERAKLPNDEIVATIMPGEADLMNSAFSPHATYTVRALGGVTLRDWGRDARRGGVKYGRPQGLTEAELTEFAKNVRWLQDPERYKIEEPYFRMRLPAGVSERNRFTYWPATHSDTAWHPTSKPAKFKDDTPVGVARTRQS